MTDGCVVVRAQEESAQARCKAIKQATKIISGEFEGDLIQVKRGINIKQMLQFVRGLLAAQ